MNCPNGLQEGDFIRVPSLPGRPVMQVIGFTEDEWGSPIVDPDMPRVVLEWDFFAEGTAKEFTEGAGI